MRGTLQAEDLFLYKNIGSKIDFAKGQKKLKLEITYMIAQQ
jgi:hypothetical protein